MMGLCEELRQAFNNCDVTEILRLLEQETDQDGGDVCFRDEAHGLQSLLMRLCHLHITSEERQNIANTLLSMTALPQINAPHPRSNAAHTLEPSPEEYVNAIDVAGRTALCHACIAERTDIIYALAQEPCCDPNKADRDGNTPLIYAVKSRRPEVVEALIDCFLDRGLQVNHCNKKGN